MAVTKIHPIKSTLKKALTRLESGRNHFITTSIEHKLKSFQDRPADLRDEFIALCAVYILLRFLCVGCMADQIDAAKAIDVAAAAFRLIDHTDFDRYAAPMLKEICGCKHISCILCL